MTKDHSERYIRTNTRRAQCTDDIVALAHAMWNAGIDQNHEGMKKSVLKDKYEDILEYGFDTVLRHLREENLGLVESREQSGPERYAIAEWMDDGDGEVVNGEVGDAAEQGLQAMIEDMESLEEDSSQSAAADGSGTTVRGVVARELGLLPKRVEGYLESTDDPVSTLNDAVDAIKEADNVEVGEGYGKIAFIRNPYLYRLSEKAVGLYER